MRFGRQYTNFEGGGGGVRAPKKRIFLVKCFLKVLKTSFLSCFFLEQKPFYKIGSLFSKSSEKQIGRPKKRSINFPSINAQHCIIEVIRKHVIFNAIF